MQLLQYSLCRTIGRAITVRHKEHLWYIRNNNPMSAYAMHILHNRHEFGPAEETLKLLKPCTKSTKMNCWEELYVNMHYKQGLLIPEPQVMDTSPLFDLTIIPCDLQTTPLHSISQPDTFHTHTPQGKSRFISYFWSLSDFFTVLLMYPLTLPLYYNPEYVTKHWEHT